MNLDEVTFEAGTMVHMRARLAYVNDATLIDEDGTLDANDAIKVSPWCIARSIEYGKTGSGEAPVSPSIPNINYNQQNINVDVGSNDNINYNYDDAAGSGELKEPSPQLQPSTDEKELKRIKIKCSVMVDGEDIGVKKPLTLYNNKKKQEFTYESLVEKASKALRRVDGIENKNVSFVVGENAIRNQEDFENYCINANDPDKIEMIASYN